MPSKQQKLYMTVADKIQAWIDKGDSDLGAAKIIYLH